MTPIQFITFSLRALKKLRKNLSRLTETKFKLLSSNPSEKYSNSFSQTRDFRVHIVQRISRDCLLNWPRNVLLRISTEYWTVSSENVSKNAFVQVVSEKNYWIIPAFIVRVISLTNGFFNFFFIYAKSLRETTFEYVFVIYNRFSAPHPSTNKLILQHRIKDI